MVMEGLQEDMGEGSMQCADHPYKNNTPGGICAFCLQEKLGKLVSSSFPVAIFPTSSSSSSPSFRSEFGYGSASTMPSRPNASSASTVNQNGRSNNNNDCHHHQYYSRRTRIPFLLTPKKKKKKDVTIATAADHVFRRSKSTTAPRRGAHFLDADDADECSSQKRGFWSFLYLSKHSTRKNISYGLATTASSIAGSSGSFSQRSREKKKEEFVAVDENESPNQASFDRKVSRSRSVGCGSRSFSGDFFERISTGFGDCTLRRVESLREGKPKVTAGGEQDCITERVKCGAEDNMNGKKAATTVGHPGHGRSKSWVWAFASPIRAFSKSSSGKREASRKNTTPNLAAIPSLLAFQFGLVFKFNPDGYWGAEGVTLYMMLSSSTVNATTWDHQLGRISTSTSKCQGSIAECQDWNEFEMDSEINRRRLDSKRYISYGALIRDGVPCSQEGASYYNCQPGAQAKPYTRGCSTITRCRHS
ncbi:hypothetical protein F0562_000629 [Nyssa sinensis]|uniref:Protein RALF-like 33 n=1 Tax=Nyssa sinensis TaxID=561372 RepID=A0A5J5C0M8_9ASTE|nr:hypothetical protein F0562_000629 [Nyssa sinensis]